jgi:hypothetical protein
MEEEIFFDDGNIRLTSLGLYHEDSFYEKHLVKDCIYIPIRPGFKDYLANVLIAILGLWLFSLFKILWIIIGLILLGIGAYNLKGMLKQVNHFVSVEIFNLSENLSIEYNNKESSEELMSVLEKYISKKF